MSNEVSRNGKQLILENVFGIKETETINFLGVGTSDAPDFDDSISGLREELSIDNNTYSYWRVPINANISFPQDPQHGGSTEFVGTNNKSVVSIGLFKQGNINPPSTSAIVIKEVGLFSKELGESGDICFSRNTLAIPVSISDNDEIAFKVTTYID